jgi:uncharacterized membrane protein
MRRHLLPLLRIAFGALFLVASVDKLLNPEAFARIIANYRLLPVELVAPAALLIPWLEAAAGAALVVNRLSRGAIVLLDAMLVVFLGALAFNTARGLDVACGCFTTSPEEDTTLFALLRDLPLLLAGLYLGWRILSQPKRKNQYSRGG